MSQWGQPPSQSGSGQPGPWGTPQPQPSAPTSAPPPPASGPWGVPSANPQPQAQPGPSPYPAQGYPAPGGYPQPGQHQPGQPQQGYPSQGQQPGYPSQPSQPAPTQVQVVTTDTVAGRQIRSSLGEVIGVAIREREIGRKEDPQVAYPALLLRSRQQAVAKMVEQARERGADAVVGMRFDSSEITQSLSEVVAYGTAVRLG